MLWLFLIFSFNIAHSQNSECEGGISLTSKEIESFVGDVNSSIEQTCSSATNSIDVGVIEIPEYLIKDASYQIAKDILKDTNSNEKQITILAKKVESNLTINKAYFVPKEDKKSIGEFSISWGYHDTPKNWISKSDIHVKSPDGGQSYDFTAHGVTAADQPKFNKILPEKGKPYLFDVPQYQATITWMKPWKDDKQKVRWGVSVRQLHSKYLPVEPKDDRYEGYQRKITGNYFGEQLDGEFRSFGAYKNIYLEYTDGENQVSVGPRIEYRVINGKKIDITTHAGVLVGTPLLHSDTYVQNKKNEGPRFHASGILAQLDAGARVTFYDHLFIESFIAGSAIKVTDGLLSDGGRIDHSYVRAQVGCNIGYSFQIKIKK